MNIAVRYYTKGGNTRKVADAIAQALNVPANDISTPLSDPVDLLFLGGSVYGFELDPELRDYIATLTPDQVKSVAIFSTSAFSQAGNKSMVKKLAQQDIPVLQPAFYCHGEFKFTRKGHPNAADLEAAAAFAKKTVADKQASL